MRSAPCSLSPRLAPCSLSPRLRALFLIVWLYPTIVVLFCLARRRVFCFCCFYLFSHPACALLENRVLAPCFNQVNIFVLRLLSSFLSNFFFSLSPSFPYIFFYFICPFLFLLDFFSLFFPYHSDFVYIILSLSSCIFIWSTLSFSILFSFSFHSWYKGIVGYLK